MSLQTRKVCGIASTKDLLSGKVVSLFLTAAFEVICRGLLDCCFFLSIFRCHCDQNVPSPSCFSERARMFGDRIPAPVPPSFDEAGFIDAEATLAFLRDPSLLLPQVEHVHSNQHALPNMQPDSGTSAGIDFPTQDLVGMGPNLTGRFPAMAPEFQLHFNHPNVAQKSNSSAGCYTPLALPLTQTVSDLSHIPTSTVTRPCSPTPHPEYNLLSAFPPPSQHSPLTHAPPQAAPAAPAPGLYHSGGDYPSQFNVSYFLEQHFGKGDEAAPSCKLPLPPASCPESDLFTPEQPQHAASHDLRVAVPKFALDYAPSAKEDFSFIDMGPEPLAVRNPIAKRNSKLPTKKLERTLSYFADELPELNGTGGSAFHSRISTGAKDVRGKQSKKVRVKKVKVVVPLKSSHHCHICARSGRVPNLLGCKNLSGQKGCRKVVCKKCYTNFGLGSWEGVTAPGYQWECIHCQGKCPEKAQCMIYAKTNARRRDLNLLKKGLAPTSAHACGSKARVHPSQSPE
jgi:hypothetical protein